MKKLLTISLSICLLALFVPAAFAKKEKGAKAASQNALAKYDTNKNGILDQDEIAAIQQEYAENKTVNLKQYDDNNNGKIDNAEIDAIKADFATATAPKEHKQKKKNK